MCLCAVLQHDLFLTRLLIGNIREQADVSEKGTGVKVGKFDLSKLNRFPRGMSAGAQGLEL